MAAHVLVRRQEANVYLSAQLENESQAERFKRLIGYLANDLTKAIAAQEANPNIGVGALLSILRGDK